MNTWRPIGSFKYRPMRRISVLLAMVWLPIWLYLRLITHELLSMLWIRSTAIFIIWGSILCRDSMTARTKLFT